MSESENGEHDADFDIKLWMIDLQISDVGQRKILSNDIKDDVLLKRLSTSDVSSIKLSVGDNRRFVDGLSSLKASDVIVQVDPPVPAVPVGAIGGNPPNGQDSGTTEVLKASFTIEEVAGFLAGSPIPQNIQNAQSSVASGHPLLANRAQVPVQAPTLSVPAS